VSPARTLLTVAVDTPAAAATSLIVTGLLTSEVSSTRDGSRSYRERQTLRRPPSVARRDPARTRPQPAAIGY
jgi:hypothetical protein